MSSRAIRLCTIAARLVAVLLGVSVAAGAQVLTTLDRIGSQRDVRARLLLLSGDTMGLAQRSLMRSSSSLNMRLPSPDSSPRFAPAMPELELTYNSRLPFSLNDGAMWSGRGVSTQVSFGGILTWRRLRVIAAPVVWQSRNLVVEFPPNPEGISEVPMPRSPFSSPYHWYSRSMDAPRRFGGEPLTRWDLGPSGIWLGWDRVTVGLTNEQEWWGPGLRNALLLSNHAPGFGHLTVRTPRPLRSPLGNVDARFLIGNLTQSEFFELEGTITTHARSISAASVTLVPRGARNLVLGVSRVVIASTEERIDAGGHLFDVLRNVPSPNTVPYGDPLQPKGRDQLFSVFGRWVLPGDGVELWGEWGRADQPVTLGDFFTSLSHSRAYTLGVQASRTAGRSRSLTLQLEHTSTAQTGSYRERPSGSWYTSRAAIQGFTQRGQVLGAAVGPGASTQWMALDLQSRRLDVGVFLSRIRWDDDAYYTIPRPNGNGLCKHDVSLIGGVRGAARMPGGDISTSVALQHRLNAYYGSTGFCFVDEQRSDRHNLTVQFSFAPVLRR